MPEITLEQLKQEVASFFTRRQTRMQAQVNYDAAVVAQQSIHDAGIAAVNTAQAHADEDDVTANENLANNGTALDVAIHNEQAQANYIAGLMGLPGFPPIDDPSPDENDDVA